MIKKRVLSLRKDIMFKKCNHKYRLVDTIINQLLAGYKTTLILMCTECGKIKKVKTYGVSEKHASSAYGE